MKINWGNTTSMPFGDLKGGDVFQHEDFLYMKCYHVKLSEFAVSLTTGAGYKDFESDEFVNLVNGEFVIK